MYGNDVYYNPEKFGLKPFVEFELEEPDYSFDILMVWKHESGKLYWATDSGCSCPSPFEDYTSLEMLEELTSASLPALVSVVRSCGRSGTEDASNSLRRIRRAVTYRS